MWQHEQYHLRYLGKAMPLVTTIVLNLFHTYRAFLYYYYLGGNIPIFLFSLCYICTIRVNVYSLSRKTIQVV